MADGSRGQLISTTTLDNEATSGSGYMNTFIFKIATDVFLVIYKYTTTIVGIKACTFSVGEGGLWCTVIDKKVISPTNKNFTGNDFYVCKARPNVYTVLYRVTGYLMYCSSFYVSPSGSIGSIDTIQVGGSNSIWPAIASDGSSYVLCGYYSSDDYYYFKSYKVESNGDIASTPTDIEVIPLALTRVLHYLSKIRSNVYATIYQDIDGARHLRTFYMNSGSITYIADINLDTMLGEQGADFFLLEPIANTPGLCLLCYKGPAPGIGRFATFTISSSGVVSSVIEQMNCVHGAAEAFQAVEIADNTVAISYREGAENWGVVEWIDVTPAGTMTHTDYVEVHEASVTTLDSHISYKGNLVIAYILEQDLKVAIMKCLDLPGTTSRTTGDRVMGIIHRMGSGVYLEELILGGLDVRWQPTEVEKGERIFLGVKYEITEEGGYVFYYEYLEPDGTITREYPEGVK